jgi:hypothetical protein
MRSGSSRFMNREAVTGQKTGKNISTPIPIKFSNVSWNEEKKYQLHEFMLFFSHHNYLSTAAINEEDYNQVKTLQAILILDQLSSYMQA